MQNVTTVQHDSDDLAKIAKLTNIDIAQIMLFNIRCVAAELYHDDSDDDDSYDDVQHSYIVRMSQFVTKLLNGCENNDERNATAIQMGMLELCDGDSYSDDDSDDEMRMLYAIEQKMYN